MSDVLNIDGLAPKLDALVEQARSTGADGELLLKQARRLLTQLREAQVVPTSEIAGGVGWHAVATREDVMCWRSGDAGASLYGAWADSRLQLVQLTVGDAVWGLRMTSSGTSYVATGTAMEGPADRHLLDRIKRETAQEKRRVAREFAARRRVCPRCSWVNDRDADKCAFCGTVDPPWGLQARRAEPVEPSVFSELEGQLTLEGLGMDLPQGLGERDAVTEVWGNIVLDAVDPNRKVSVVRAVMDAAERAGAERLGLADAKALVEHLPAIVCRNVPATQAAEIQRRLDQAGASTRFERGHD